MKICWTTFLFLLLTSYALTQSFDSKEFEANIQMIDHLFEYEDLPQISVILAKLDSQRASLNNQQSIQLDLRQSKKYLLERKTELAEDLLDKIEPHFSINKDSLLTEYFFYLKQKGEVAFNQAQFDKSESYIQKAKNTLNTLAGNNIKKIVALNLDFADLFERQGNSKKAIKILEQSKNDLQENSLNESILYSLVLNKLYLSYSSINLSSKAYSNLLKAINIQEKILGYSKLWVNVGTHNYEQDNFQESENAYLKHLKILDSLQLNESVNYSIVLSNLSGLYTKVKQNNKALTSSSKAVDHFESLGITDNDNYIFLLNQLSNATFYATGNIQKSKVLWLKCKSILDNSSNQNLDYYALITHNLAFVYEMTDELDKAEKMYLDALNQEEKFRGKQTVDYMVASNNLGRLYQKQGKFEQAIPVYTEVYQILKSTFPELKKEYAQVCLQLAVNHFYSSDLNSSIEYARKSPAYIKTFIHKIFPFLNEREKYEFLNTMDAEVTGFSILKSLAAANKVESLNDDVFDILLFEKGLLLNTSLQTKKYIFFQDNPEALSSFIELQNLKKELTPLLYNYNEHSDQIDSLEIMIGDIEIYLGKLSSHYREELIANKVSVKDLKNVLQQDEVILEFTHFNKLNINPQAPDTIIYAVNVLDPQKEHSLFVPLFSESEIKETIRSETNNSQFISALYGIVERGVEVEKKGAQSLYKMIWEPIEDLVKDKNTIYYSPSGLLSRINLGAIAINEEEVLGDQYSLVNLLSTRSITTKDERVYDNTAYIVGAVNYEVEANKENNDLAAQETASNKATRELTGESWSSLSWTKKETEAISKTLTNNGFNVSSKSNSDASEEDFKYLGLFEKSPRVIHLATHGFFFSGPDLKSNNNSFFKNSDNPMIRSGLILAGANHVWGGNDPVDGEEDGILTALEISQMNLSNTELVVLSACETGLGDIKGSEGVYGLQRAFKMAGVKNIIMTLWQVPDRSTSVFMKQFYKNWIDQKIPLKEAFNKTQLEMRDRFFDPYMWAGFVLVE